MPNHLRFKCISDVHPDGYATRGLTPGKVYDAMGPACRAIVDGREEMCLFIIRDDLGRDRWMPLLHFQPTEAPTPEESPASKGGFFSRLFSKSFTAPATTRS